ncbi:Clp protease N-terminal domain-containing protein [Crossiella sp. CA198]|uniref:Clp protease N-terminal domain-containing protein n=1 Tax=Crossiella sp. CA198 TaxID=3455607 RepID=UPI003F8D38F3
MSAIDHYLQRIILRGAEEAQAEAGSTIEAQHLLLAIAAEPDPVLAAAGLDRAAIRAALDTEFAHSLAAAGVDRAAFDLRSTPSPDRPTKVGATAKLALERGFARVSRKKDLRPAHITLGVLLAEVGTVPRALALAGIDRAGLTEQLSRHTA